MAASFAALIWCVLMRWGIAVFLFSATAVAQPQPLVVSLGSQNVDFVLVPAGTFEQGSPATEKNRGADEEQRSVTISKGFFMQKTPVTFDQFSIFVKETGYKTEAEKGASGGSGWDGAKLTQKKEYTWKNPGFPQSGTNPVVLVTYDDALAFARWLEGKAHHHVSLPTEAQYEYAQRAGTTTAFYDADPLELGWFKENAGVGTRAVGSKKPNAWGLYDMGGNVYEWCRDWYGPYSGGGTDPETLSPPSGDTARRVLRGGSWLKSSDHGRSAARYRNTPGSRNADNGFRVVADLDELPAMAATTPPVVVPTQTPLTSPQPSSSGSSALPWLAGGGVLAAIVALFFALRRKAPSGVTTRPTDDGFVIDSSLPQGTSVRWQAIVNGTDVGDVVRIEGASTFVYTGGRPTNIRIVSVEYPEGPRGGGGYRGRAPVAASPPRRYVAPPQQPIVQDDPPFRGYPPAY